MFDDLPKSLSDFSLKRLLASGPPQPFEAEPLSQPEQCDFMEMQQQQQNQFEPGNRGFERQLFPSTSPSLSTTMLFPDPLPFAPASSPSTMLFGAPLQAPTSAFLPAAPAISPIASSPPPSASGSASSSASTRDRLSWGHSGPLLTRTISHGRHTPLSNPSTRSSQHHQQQLHAQLLQHHQQLQHYQQLQQAQQQRRYVAHELGQYLFDNSLDNMFAKATTPTPSSPAAAATLFSPQLQPLFPALDSMDAVPEAGLQEGEESGFNFGDPLPVNTGPTEMQGTDFTSNSLFHLQQQQRQLQLQIQQLQNTLSPTLPSHVSQASLSPSTSFSSAAPITSFDFNFPPIPSTGSSAPTSTTALPPGKRRYKTTITAPNFDDPRDIAIEDEDEGFLSGEEGEEGARRSSSRTPKPYVLLC